MKRAAVPSIFVVVVLLAVGVTAEAQQTGKVPRMGFLDNSTASGSAVLSEAFWQEIRKLGWIEGKNITIEYRFTEGKNSRLPELAADLVRLKVDLIVVTGTIAALAAKRATTTIPILFTGSAAWTDVWRIKNSEQSCKNRRHWTPPTSAGKAVIQAPGTTADAIFSYPAWSSSGVQPYRATHKR